MDTLEKDRVAREVLAGRATQNDVRFAADGSLDGLATRGSFRDSSSDHHKLVSTHCGLAHGHSKRPKPLIGQLLHFRLKG